MHAVSEAALALGSDSSLAGVSAAGAADAINELAKGGLTLDQAMQAARGTIQLATAGQLDFGRAAEITSNTLAQFNLQATDASRVGDVLAAASVASTAGVEDLAQALNYAGPSAANLKISLEDTTTALALLAQGGVKGSEAGTQLRGMLVALAAPSKPAANALKTLGVNAFDASGKFVGLTTLSGQLALAQASLSDEAFQSATAIAFGRESMGAAIQLAKGGPNAFKAMGTAVREQGAAAKLAGANTQGLGGALESLQGDVETTGIRVYQFIKGPLEGLVRGTSDAVGSLNDVLSGDLGGFKLDPNFAATIGQAVDVGKGLFEDFQTIAENAGKGVSNAVEGIGAAVSDLAGPAVLGAAVTGIGLLGDGLAAASTILGPIGSVVGGIASAFAALPGPLQAALFGFLALKVLPGILTGMNQAVARIPFVGGAAASSLSNLGSRFTAIPGQTAGAVQGLRNFGQQVGVQQSLARLGGQEIGKFGGSVAALATRFPATSAAATSMANSFRAVNTAATNFGNTAGAAVTRGLSGIPGAASGAVSGLRNIPGAVTSAATSLRTGLGAAATSAATSLRNLPAVASTVATGLGRSFAGAGTAVANGLRAIPTAVTNTTTAVANGFRAIPGLVTSGIGAIPGAAGSAVTGLGRLAGAFGGVGAAAVTGLAKVGSGIIGALGGPFGLAITGAIVGLSLFSQANQKAKAADDERKRSLEQLAGTFDKVTGAATKATSEMQAQELVSFKLKDGTTSLYTALGQLGISQSDYVKAAQGNLPLQENIRSRLTATTQATVLSSDAWNNSKQAIGSAGISIELATQAAMGNVDAQEQVRAKLEKAQQEAGRFGAAFNGVADALINSGGAAGEVSSRFNEAIGKVNDAKDAAKAAGVAIQDFGETLTAISTNNGFAAVADSLKTGAPIAKELALSFQAVGASAGSMATEAGKASFALTGNVSVAADAAGQKMGALREQFLVAAVGAGLTTEQAEKLANQIGLIPAAAKTIFETNASGVGAELITLKSQFDAVPGSKSVTISTLSADAETKLEAIGFTVKRLPNGQVVITGEDSDFKLKLDGAIASAAGTPAKVPITGDPQPLIDRAAEGKLSAGSTPAVVPIQGDPAPFGVGILTAQGQASGSVATLPLDGNPILFAGKLNAAINQAGSSTGILSLDGNPTMVNGKIQQAVTFADGSKGTVTLDGNPNPATGKINGVVTYGNGRTSRISVDANTGLANSQISGLVTRWNGYTININAVVSSRVGGLAAGGIVDERGIQAYARGGVDEWNGKKLRKMRGGLASVVPARSYRVIGDNTRVKESYIPWNKSARSLAILQRTANEFGFSLQKMTAFADGGIAVRRASSLVSSMRTMGSAFNVGQLLAELQQIRNELSTAQRTINVYQTAHNPIREKASDTLVKGMRTLGQMGAFGD